MLLYNIIHNNIDALEFPPIIKIKTNKLTRSNDTFYVPQKPRLNPIMRFQNTYNCFGTEIDIFNRGKFKFKQSLKSYFLGKQN